MFGAAASYRRATAGSSHDDAHPDYSTLHTGKNFSFPPHVSKICSSTAATASRRRGNDLGTTIKYLRKTTSGAASTA
jgi:hypothetical protein